MWAPRERRGKFLGYSLFIWWIKLKYLACLLNILKNKKLQNFSTTTKNYFIFLWRNWTKQIFREKGFLVKIMRGKKKTIDECKIWHRFPEENISKHFSTLLKPDFIHLKTIESFHWISGPLDKLSFYSNQNTDLTEKYSFTKT